MTKEELKQDIDKIISSYNELNDTLESLIELGMIDCSGNLYNVIWMAFENVLDILEKRLDTDLISHYIWELDCGNKTSITTEDVAEAILEKK